MVVNIPQIVLLDGQNNSFVKRAWLKLRKLKVIGEKQQIFDSTKFSNYARQ